MTFEEIRNSGNLLFESVRGSHLFGLDMPGSDIDTFGLFISPIENLMGTGLYYEPMVCSDKNDDSWSELKKFIVELGKSNPNALEAIHTPEKWIRYYNPVLDPLWNIRDRLITKASFKSFGNYALSQIKKAKGLKKAINTDPEEVRERKNPLYFSWVPRPGSDGAWTLEKWLRENGLKQEHCGITRLPNGIEFYTLYYDWFADKDLRAEDYARLRYGMKPTPEIEKELEEGKKTTMIKYRGIMDHNNDTTQLRLSSISKEDSHHPLISFQYNMNAFSSHCKKYKEYWEWVVKRNPQRFELNKGYDFDAKNMSACVRIMTMATEMAQGLGMRLDRSGIDRDFLLKIKTHQMTYDEIMITVEDLEKKMNDAFESSTLPESPDLDELEKIMMKIRMDHYGIKYIH